MIYKNTPKLKTLKDFQLKPKSWAEAMTNAGRKHETNVTDLRRLAIEWIKKDIEESVDNLYDDKSFFKGTASKKEKQEYLKGKKDYLKHIKRRGIKTMPNGKYCDCDEESGCRFHREGYRLMEFFNIEENELK